MRSKWLDELIDIVGAAHVLTDPGMRRSYETDWTGRYSGECSAVVRPGSADDVAAVLRICAAEGVDVIPQAGNTGLVGGSVPRRSRGRETVVLSLVRLDHLGQIDELAMQVSAGAGVTIAAWRDRARAAGFDAPVDFASRDTATIGGAIATNAGGSRVLRFGTMRQQVVSVEAVLADGSIVGSMSGLPKETAGLHWPSLLTGSEGTLAVVTAARLRVVPWYRHTATALVATTSIDAAIALLASLRRQVDTLDAVELIQPAALELVSRHLGETAPVTAPPGGSLVMIDCAAHDEPIDALLAVLADDAGITASAVATDPIHRARLTAFRDRITEAIAAASTVIGVPTYKLDVAVPVEHLGELLLIAEHAAADDGCRLIPFGHLAEGNVHLNHLGANDPARIADTVLHAVADFGGTISAEHGIGVAKTRWLPLIRTAPELAAQRSIKDALDPQRILNPGVLDPGVLDPGVLEPGSTATGSTDLGL